MQVWQLVHPVDYHIEGMRRRAFPWEHPTRYTLPRERRDLKVVRQLEIEQPSRVARAEATARLLTPTNTQNWNLGSSVDCEAAPAFPDILSQVCKHPSA